MTAKAVMQELELAAREYSEGLVVKAASRILAVLESSGSAETLSSIDDDLPKALLEIGHGIFNCDVALGRRLYSAAWTVDLADYLSILRLVEGSIDNADFINAANFMEVLRSRYELEAFGYLALSHILQAQRNTDGAVAAIIRAREMLPCHPWLRRQVCLRLLELRQASQAMAEIEWFSADPQLEIEDVTRELPLLNFRAAVLQADPESLLKTVDDIDYEWGHIEDWVYAEAIYKLGEFDREWTRATKIVLRKIYQYLVNKSHHSESACLAAIRYHVSQGHWDQADALLANIGGTALYDTRRMRLRRFELACHFQRFEEALDLFNANWQGKRDLDAEEIVLSMRFCSELKDWNQASQYAEQLMRRGFSLMDDSYGYFQIIRRSDRHLEFLSIIGESGRDDEFSCCIRDLLVDDLCVLSGRSAVDTPLGSRSISERNAILVKGHISEEALSETNQQAIFLCTDKAYFFSVLTMLASLATWSVDSADCYIFLSNDVPRHWVPSLEDFCRRLGIEIFVIYEDHLSIASNGCSVEYGLFSGGRSLARAAYFRIYAAKWLWQKQTYRRVLYVDSDIVCQKPLNSVFHLDLRGKAMAARPEEINDGVRKASKKCEVDIGEYINSGVILFDLCHPRMEELLDGAIWQAENGGPRLTFHDQCALNIAFAGQIAHLPSRFNYYLRPFKHYGENDLRDGTLLHYLDRPKPWDSGCNFSHRHPWTAAAHTVRTLVSPDYYYETVATSLGRTVQQQMKSTNELHSGIASPKISYLTHHAPKIVSHA